MNEKTKKILLVGGATVAGALVIYLLLHGKGYGTLTTAASPDSPGVQNTVPTSGDVEPGNYTITFPAAAPTTIAGGNISVGGNDIGGCGCCDQGSALQTKSAAMQGLGASNNSQLFNAILNLNPTGQTALPAAFG